MTLTWIWKRIERTVSLRPEGKALKTDKVVHGSRVQKISPMRQELPSPHHYQYDTTSLLLSKNGFPSEP